MEDLEAKRIEVLEAIKDSGQRETLRIGNTRIGCSCNSISAVIEELVGYIFIARWRDRNLGAFSIQTKNVIKRYWIK